MSNRQYRSWGRVFRRPQQAERPLWLSEFSLERLGQESSILAYGNGRSYGDSCLNSDGLLLDTRSLNHFLGFDPATGVVRCEAGVTLQDIIQVALPTGWFLAATPGTQFVTVGGAVANDVHGKNHHAKGSFGHHVRCFELVRSNGEKYRCSRDENPELFHATIGGLGLTGLISWVEIQLMPVPSAWVDTEIIPYHTLEEFLQLSADSEASHEYTVAWVDCMATGAETGKGIFIRGNHADGYPLSLKSGRKLNFPVELPLSAVNRLSVTAFNRLYYWMQARKAGNSVQFYEPFFYPLDGILNWNRLYGRKGFFQYQFVVPLDAVDTMRQVMREIAESGNGSMLTVLKVFGDVPAEGLLSFPRAGITFALDFPNNGERVHALFRRLDALVQEAGGTLYPAKDGRMSPEIFRQGYPRLEEFAQWIDPAFHSDFYERVMVPLLGSA